jgi:ribonuclease M5
MSVKILRETFEKAGIVSDDAPHERVTKQDLYELGLSGRPESRERRKELCKELSLPEYLSAPALLDALWALYDREQFLEMMKERNSLG